jgi:6-phosphogluconolactonase
LVRNPKRLRSNASALKLINMNLRQTITAFLMSLLAAGLCSCGSSHGTHLLYVTTGQGIYAFRIDNKSRNSTPIFSAPFAVGNASGGIVISPSGQFAYVANEDDNTISTYKIDTVSGTLTEVLPRTPVGAFSPNNMVLDSSGTTLFVGNQLSNNVSAFSVGSDGALAQLSAPAPVGSQPSNLVFANGLLFVAVPNFSRVYVFTVSSGALTAVTGSPMLVSGSVGNITVDPSAKFLYVPNPANNTISAFSIQYVSGSNSIGITPIPGSPFTPTGTPPTAPVAALLDPSSTHLYVTNFGSASVSQFSIGTDGSLTSLTPATASAGTSPAMLVMDSDGKHVLVGNVGSNNVTDLVINSDATLGSAGQSILVRAAPQGLGFTK